MACTAGTLVPARAAVYAGESLVAAAAVRVRGTDGEMYQVEVQVARHDLRGAKVDHVLRFRLAVCETEGCFGPWYPIPVKAADVVFTADTAFVRGVFAGSPFTVEWKARRAKKELNPMAPAPAVDNAGGAVVVTTHRDVRSAPALIRLPGLPCKTPTSTIANQVGAIATVEDESEPPPSRLPAGFFRTAKRTPRCF